MQLNIDDDEKVTNHCLSNDKPFLPHTQERRICIHVMSMKTKASVQTRFTVITNNGHRLTALDCAKYDAAPKQ